MPEPPPPRLRGAAADDAIREQLVPLAPGERPGRVTLCAVLVMAAGLGNLLLYALGRDLGYQHATSLAFGVLPAFIGVMLGVGLLRVEYLAMLGMQLLLVITAIFATGSLLTATNVTGLLISLVTLAGSSALFWSLIRIMARLQLRDQLARR